LDIDEIAMASDGCTPADLKRLVNEAKIKFAWDESQQRTMKSLAEYDLEAIADLRQLKQRYHESRQNGLDSPNRPDWFDVAAP
jgi:hypothetical protein